MVTVSLLHHIVLLIDLIFDLFYNYLFALFLLIICNSL